MLILFFSSVRNVIKCQVSGNTYLGLLCEGSLNAFVIVFVFVFVIVVLMVRSCLLVPLIKCLKGHKYLGLLFECIFKMSLSLSVSILVRSCLLITVIKSHKSLVFVFVIVFLLVRSWLLITRIRCIKGHKSLGLLFEGVL